MQLNDRMRWVNQPDSEIIGDCEVFTRDDPSHFKDMPEEKREKITAWIKANILQGKTVWKERSSYKLKHDIEHQIGIYMTNNQFKEAMLICGFEPVDAARLSWYYRIDRKSPICIWYKERPFDTKV